MPCEGEAALAALCERALAGEGRFLLMEDTARIVSETLGVEFSGVFELTGGESSLLLRAGAGWGEGSGAAMPAGDDSPGGYTLRAGAPVAVEDFAAGERFVMPELLHRAGVASGVMAAIRGRGRPFGVLGAFTGARSSRASFESPASARPAPSTAR